MFIAAMKLHVLNAAARLVVKKRKWKSITPTMRDVVLHWLLVRHRIDFKICLLVYKSMSMSMSKVNLYSAFS